jgi:hypothetical protein
MKRREYMPDLTNEQYQEYIDLKEKEGRKTNFTKFLKEIENLVYAKVQEERNQADSLQDYYYWVCKCCGKASEETLDDIEHHEGCNHGEKIKILINKYNIKKCSAWCIVEKIPQWDN